MKSCYSEQEADRKNESPRANEAGYGVIIVIIILFFFFALIVGSVSSSLRSDRSVENLATKQTEKWEAKSALATLKRIIEVRLPERYESDLEMAKACLADYAEVNRIEAFDGQDLSSEQSVPVLKTFAGGENYCNNQSNGSFTSLLGNTNLWGQNRVSLWMKEAESFGFRPTLINVARIAETVRRFNNVGDPVYQFGFIIDARGGQHYRVREQGEVEVGAIGQNCGATGRLEINPLSVQQGNSAGFRITYTNINRLRILNQNNIVIYDNVVTESSDPQIFDWSYAPTVTGSYRVEALSSNAGCFSRSEWVQLEVTAAPPTCPVIDNLAAAPNSVQSGDNTALTWAVRNAFEVTLEGEIVSLNGSKNFQVFGTRTYTLTARDAGNVCPATRQVTVTLQPPPCLSPSVAVFQINPGTTNPGNNVTINWQVNNVMPGGVVNISLPDGTVLTNVGDSGTRNIAAPGAAGNFNYSINVTNPCGSSASANTQLQVVNACTPPIINSLFATPDIVTRGGTDNITISWNVSGNIESQSIDSVGNVGGNSHTFVQPNATTTYTYTVSGCGQTRQSQVTVRVNDPVAFACENVITSGGGRNGEPTTGNKLYYDYGASQPSTGWLNFTTSNSGGSISANLDYSRDYTTRYNFNGGVMGQDCDYTDYTFYISKVEFFDLDNNLVYASRDLFRGESTNFNFFSGRPLAYFIMYTNLEQYQRINDGTGGCYDNFIVAQGGGSSICTVR